MRNVEQLAKSIKMELADEYYQRLHKSLMERDKEWLVEEMIKLIAKTDEGTLGRQLLNALSDLSKAEEEGLRMGRIKSLKLDELKLSELIDRFNAIRFTRDDDDIYLVEAPPQKGGDPIIEAHRTDDGNDLLEDAKDLLYALLYGTRKDRVSLKRVEHEILSIIVPTHKAYAFAFLRTVTEIASLGSWRDPKMERSDNQASNSILEVQYGEVASERVGDGIIAALRIINELEVNEKVLYAHMRDVEQSSLDLEMDAD